VEVFMAPVTRSGSRPRQSFARLLLAVFAVLTLVAACGGATATPAASLGAIDLDGTSWRLIGYLSPTGTHFTVPAAVTPGAKFTGGQFEGQTGCNTANGPYTLNGTAIKIGPVGATQKACPDPMGSVETAYLAAIGTVDTAVGNDTTLLLRKADGFTALEFVRANP
jgi:heat shock protein HslJ